MKNAPTRRRRALLALLGAGTAAVLALAATSFGGTSSSTLTLGPAVVVDRGAVSTPALAAAPGSSVVYVAWTRASKLTYAYGGKLGEGYVARSTNGGRTFGRPVRVEKLGNIQAPQVLAVTPRGTVLDAWASWTKVKAPEGGFDYWLARSTNGGASFTARKVTDGGVQSVSRPNLTVAPNGDVWATWLDGRPLDRTSSDPLFNVDVALSRADGLGFTPSWTVKGNACQCCRPALAARPGHDGTLALVWRDVLQRPGSEGHGMQMDGTNPDGSANPKAVYPKTDIRSIRVAVSTDLGHDFGTAHPVNDFSWKIQACPTIGPALWYSADGSKLRVAWFTGAVGHIGVYYAESRDGGNSFSKPVKLSGDIVAEGYDLAFASGPGDSAYVGWATPDYHLQVARIASDGHVSWTPKLKGDRVALTSLHDGSVLLSYAGKGALVVRNVGK